MNDTYYMTVSGDVLQIWIRSGQMQFALVGQIKLKDGHAAKFHAAAAKKKIRFSV